MTSRLLIPAVAVILAFICPIFGVASEADYTFPAPDLDSLPETYICYMAASPRVIDGKLDEYDWQATTWTDEFVDIMGDAKPAPRFATRVAMLWDNDYLYIGAKMEEPDVWGTLRERDSVIYYDNDFEVFIDPDGDTHEYYELEINALGTEWDLLLTKPYRDDGTAVDSWDIKGLLSGVHVYGTLNEPGDVDRGWSVEIAIPWDVLEECAHKATVPRPGEQWRLNFSRVEWRAEVLDGKYVKLTDPETGKDLPEDNWVWSPQGLIAMHYPEMWGFVQFSDLKPGEGWDRYFRYPEDDAKLALMKLYYAQRTYFREHGRFSDDAGELGLVEAPVDGVSWPPTITVTPRMFEATVAASDGKTVSLTQDGHLGVSK